MNVPFADKLLYRYVKKRHDAGFGVAPVSGLCLKDISRVLLVLTTGLGDAVLSTPVFPSLRRAMPGADIRLFVRANWADLFSSDPNLDGVIKYRGKYRRFFPTIRELRDFSPELTVILHGNDPDIVPLSFLSGSRFIVRIPWGRTLFPFLLSNTGRKEDEAILEGVHYVDNRLRILDTLGIKPVGAIPSVVLDKGLLAVTRKKMDGLLGERSDYWIYHPFAADRYKRWPMAKARELLLAAVERLPEMKIILTGSSRERKDADCLSRGLPGSGVINLAGELSLAETAACIEGAAFLVGPDTGILHLAAALETPVVGLYAPTSAALVGPRSKTAACRVIQKRPVCAPCPTKRCPYETSRCMDNINVDEVLEGVLFVAEHAGGR